MHRTFPRLTPWVQRLLLTNAVVLFLMLTVVTSQAFLDLIRFDPALALQRPWTFLTYLFAHGGLLHLGANSMALFVFGPPVERRLGGLRFLGYYLGCGVGAALVSLGIWALFPAAVGPFIGASGAVLGVAFAFAALYPDAELLVFPIPVPLKARQLVALYVVFDVVGAVLGSDNIAHIAHLGGLACGWLFFRIGRVPQAPAMIPMQPIRRHAPITMAHSVPMAHRPQTAREIEPVEIPVAEPPIDPVVLERAEIDRVLDKILASGIESLTADERRLLEAQRRHDAGH